MAAAPVLDLEEEPSMDIILVDSSELSSPPSPGPSRGGGSFKYWPHHLGCQLQAWAVARVPDFIPMLRQGWEGPTLRLPLKLHV